MVVYIYTVSVGDAFGVCRHVGQATCPAMMLYHVITSSSMSDNEFVVSNCEPKSLRTCIINDFPPMRSLSILFETEGFDIASTSSGDLRLEH